jgi:outer membrane receptor protein involved in Fe transport
VGQKTVIDALGDVGGWNATAKLDYQFAALLGYKVSLKWTLLAGYRYLFVHYRPSNFSVINLVTPGAVLGLTINLK